MNEQNIIFRMKLITSRYIHRDQIQYIHTIREVNNLYTFNSSVSAISIHYLRMRIDLIFPNMYITASLSIDSEWRH